MSTQGLRVGVALALIAGTLASATAASAATPSTVTIAAAAPATDNCWPFGTYHGAGDWSPNFAFVYKNIPPFQLRSGDNVAFDLGFPNDVDITLAMAMAHTTVNGNDVNDGPFTTVANSQTPANPRGDSIEGDYELRWTVNSTFAFPGGGLLIRFSDPSPAFAADLTCDGTLTGAVDGADASAYFVERTYQDADGVSPWDGSDSGPIGQFRLTLQPTSNTFSFGKVIRNKEKGTARLPVTVPGPGTVTLSGKGVKARTAGGPSAHVSVTAAGTVNLTIKPKGKLKKKLLARHKARVAVSITFAPGAVSGHPAGDPTTQKKRIKLIRR